MWKILDSTKMATSTLKYISKQRITYTVSVREHHLGHTIKQHQLTSIEREVI